MAALTHPFALIPADMSTRTPMALVRDVTHVSGSLSSTTNAVTARTASPQPSTVAIAIVRLNCDHATLQDQHERRHAHWPSVLVEMQMVSQLSALTSAQCQSAVQQRVATPWSRVRVPVRGGATVFCKVN
jgi:hypothetical protein